MQIQPKDLTITFQLFDGKFYLSESLAEWLSLGDNSNIKFEGVEGQAFVFSTNRDSNGYRLTKSQLFNNRLAGSSMKACQMLAKSECRIFQYQVSQNPVSAYLGELGETRMALPLINFQVIQEGDTSMKHQGKRLKEIKNKVMAILQISDQEYEDLRFDNAFEHMDHWGYGSDEKTKALLQSDKRFWNWWKAEYANADEEAINRLEIEVGSPYSEIAYATTKNSFLRKELMDTYQNIHLGYKVYPPRIVFENLEGEKS